MALTTREPSSRPGDGPSGASRWPDPVGASAGLWWGAIGVTVVALLIPVVVSFILVQTLYNPPSRDLPTPLANQGASGVTRVFDSTGRQIAAFNRFETRIPVTRADIPQVLKDAVVSIEDRRFYDHEGIDLRAILRALWADFQGGSYEQGASTITQQYVKRLYTGPQRSLARKMREAVLASRVDDQLEKDEILFRYLDDLYLGNGAYGVGAASETYFRKAVRDLTISEAAMLAGLIQTPSGDDPRSNTSAAEERRQAVLRAMAEEGRINSSERDAALSQRLVLATEDSSPNTGVTLVYPPERADTTFPYFTDYVRRYLIARYGEDKVYKGGLTVESTIDPRIQEQAEAAVRATLAGTSPPLEMSLVSLDPNNGYVKALVGGRDFTKSQVNLALGNCTGVPKAPPNEPVCVDGGGSGRQPGSSFKPFTLAKALEKGISPNKVYSGPTSYRFRNCTDRGPESGCTVGNAEGGGFGPLPLRQATAHSVNTVYAQLIEEVGVEDTAEMAHRMGLTMVRPDAKLGPGRAYGPSLTLGPAEVSPVDMASAFGVFARRGDQFPATPVARVLEPNGKPLEDNTIRRPRRVISQNIADTVNDILKGVITFGTGTAADIGRPDGVAGKTGTSEDYSDAWFVGYTQQLSTSVWMGYANSQRPLLNIKGVGKVFGGTLPAQTWKAFMNNALSGVPNAPFPAPAALANTQPFDGPRGSGPSGGRGRGGDSPAPPEPVVTAPTEPTIPPITFAGPGATTPATSPTPLTVPVPPP